MNRPWPLFVPEQPAAVRIHGLAIGIDVGDEERRRVFPACAALNLPNATWLTFRRTYASWAHDQGVPGKVVAQLMGHTNADVTFNVYTQVLDASLRTAVDRIGGELFMNRKRGLS